MAQGNTFEQHQQKVAGIVAQVKDLLASGAQASLKKGNVSHTVPDSKNPKHQGKKINIRGLTEVLEINPEKRYCIAESGITFEALVHETLKHGLVPKTVSELKGITIGGAVAGCSVESMSYKFGGFHDSCLEYEIVTGTGEVLKISPEHESLTFEMVHGSFGTLGILTALKFELVPAKSFVKMEYIQFPDLASFQAAIREHFECKDVDLMDGIIHSPELFVLCLGTFVDEVPYTNSYKWMKIFYKSTRKLKVDYLKTLDYFFRYDTECHWLTRQYGLENKALRFLVGNFLLGSTNILKWANRLKFGQKGKKNAGPDVIVDVFIPNRNLEDFYQWYLKEWNYWPVWIVPYKIDPAYPWVDPKFLEPVKDETLFIDWAIYGFQQPPDGRNYYKMLEDKLMDVQGIKTLITFNYYDEETFWSWYNKANYDAVKQKVDPQNLFRNVFEKMVYR